MKALALAAALVTAGIPAAASESLRRVGQDATAQAPAAVVVSEALALVHTAQLLPLDSRDQIVAAGQADAQCEAVLDRLTAVLREAGVGAGDWIKVNVYAAQTDVVPVFRAALARRMADKARPAVAYVVGALADPAALVAVDAVAATREPPRVRPVARRSLPSLSRRWTGAHVATLPAGGRLYVSGQAQPGSNVAEATRKTLAQLAATLDALGLQKGQVVQAKSFLQPIGAVDDAAGELTRFFGPDAVPPLVFAEWRMSAPIEIELIVAGARQDGGEPVEYLTPPGLKPSPVFSRVARINRGDTIFVSGLYGPMGASGEKQVEGIFETLRSVLNEAGSDFRHLAKATYYVSDDEASQALNNLRPRFYDPARPPAASKAAVAGVGEEGRSVTLDMIAVPRSSGR